MDSIKFLATVICEDVRREDNGRAILIGTSMVGPSIDTNEGSVIDRLAFYMEAEISGSPTAKFRLVGKDRNQSIFELEMGLDFSGESSPSVSDDGEPITEDRAQGPVGAAIVISREKIEFPTAGKYDLQFMIDGEGDWQLIRSFYFPARTD